MELYCILIIEAWLKLNMHFDSRYRELLSECILKLFYILLNVRNGIEFFFSEHIDSY